MVTGAHAISDRGRFLSRIGMPSRLVAKLFRDDAWGVGYYDGRNVIFINRAGNELLPLLDKQQVMADVIRRLRR